MYKVHCGFLELPNAGGRHDTLVQETKDFITLCKQHGPHCWVCSSCPSRGNTNGILQLENNKLRKHQSFIMNRLHASPPVLPSREPSLLYWTANMIAFCPRRRHCSIFHLFPEQISLSREKGCLHLCSEDTQNVNDPKKEILVAGEALSLELPEQPYVFHDGRPS